MDIILESIAFSQCFSIITKVVLNIFKTNTDAMIYYPTTILLLHYILTIQTGWIYLVHEVFVLVGFVGIGGEKVVLFVSIMQKSLTKGIYSHQ